MTIAARRTLSLLFFVAAWLPPGPALATFTTFETGQVRPLAMSPDGSRLFAVNTPDNRLEIFALGPAGLSPEASVPVGLEPLAVAARTNTEVWVVNHLSDSVSIVDVGATPPRVVRTLLVGDEPRDIVFAGPGGNRAFITTAHRGQNSPVNPQLTTAGVGRADVWVFDATNLGTSLGGTPLAILTLFGDTPRALAVAPGGATVYAAVFHSGNRTTAISEGLVCDGGASAPPCVIAGTTYPGGLPAPNSNFQGIPGPETGLILKFDGTAWRDPLGRDWSNAVRFSLPDLDVFAIDANATPPAQTASYAGVGTILFNMLVNPANGKVYVTNTEARNEVRFEGPGTFFGSTTVRGRLHEARITVLSGTSVLPRHLNKHIDYGVVPSPPGVKAKSLATPLGMAIDAAGTTLYVAAFGSSKIGVFSTAALENDTFVPNAADHIEVAGGGPSGLVLDEARGRLYVATRFDNAVAVLDTATRLEIQRVALHDAEPAIVRAGRPVLYDARLTSSNGEASCASCHVFGDLDSLGWDLGDPDAVFLNNPNPIEFNIGQDPDFHPLKGPMTTQSLRGMANHGPMHWRGDRTGGNDPGGDPLAEDQAFKKFIVAFEGLLGRAEPISDADMQRFTDFILEVTYPPNPIRALDNSLAGDALAGRNLYFGRLTDTVRNCNGCHTLDPALGFFGTRGFTSFENESQMFKIAHLRNLYQKVGMFGMPEVPGIAAGNNGHQGPQIRGFGFLHDGSVDTVFRFLRASVFTLNNTERRQLEQFLFRFDSNLAPIVGQQITLTSTNAAVVGPRIDLLRARDAVAECDLVVKGTLAGEARGWLSSVGGAFISDRVTEAPLSDSALRAIASTPGQELTYTCVPSGSGVRAGIDRDEDGFRDRDELDAGTDPADPSSFPGAPAFTLIQTSRLSLRDRSTPPANPDRRKISFRALTARDAPANRIVPPAPGSPDDPTIGGGVLVVYNAVGLTTDAVTIGLPAAGWRALGGSGYRFSGPSGSAIRRIDIRPDRLTVKGGQSAFGYSLDESSQGRIGLRLVLGSVGWCADAPARATGNPPSSARYDRVDRFVAQRRSPPPTSCPAVP